jgi:tagatose-1,6-bisphosphate aldolase non-catalytic subunit AgaZ/GatZ
VMSTVPPPAGEVAVIWVEEFTVKEVAASAPNFTAVDPVKSVPVITTEVPPPGGPVRTLRFVTVTGDV